MRLLSGAAPRHRVGTDILSRSSVLPAGARSAGGSLTRRLDMGRLTKLALSIAIAVAVGSASYAAAQQGNQPAEQKWTGNISDAMCGVSHGANGGDMTKDHDCAVKCARNGGR